MFLKFLQSNLKHSIKTYYIYLIINILIVALFYSLNTMTSKYFDIGIHSINEIIVSVLDAMAMVSMLFIMVSFVLIFYITNFIFNLRKKEFGTYVLMGLEQNKIGLVFLFEILVVGIVSIFLGIIVGSIISNFILSLVLGVVLEEPLAFKVMLYRDTIFSVIQIFLLQYIVICIIYYFRISKLNTLYFFKTKFKLIEMKQYKKRDTYIGVICFILPLVSTNAIIEYISSSNIFTIQQIIEINRIVLIASVVIFLIGSINIFKAICNIFIKIKENQKIRYNKLNLIWINNIIYSIRKNNFLLIAMCAVSAVYIGALSLTLMSEDYRRNLTKSSDFYFDMTFNINGLAKNIDDEKLQEANDIILSEIKQNYKIEDVFYLEQYILDEENPNIRLVPLEDYNSIRKELGLEQIVLEDGKFALHYDLEQTESLPVYNINGKEYYYSGKSFTFSNKEIYLQSENIIILPYDDIKDLYRRGIVMEVNTDEYITYDDFEEISKLTNIYEDMGLMGDELAQGLLSADRPTVNITSPALSYNNRVSSDILLNTIVTYIVIGFFATQMILLFINIFSDIDKEKVRYNLLRKMGANNKDINNCIRRQFNVYFILPFILGLIVSIILLGAFIA